MNPHPISHRAALANALRGIALGIAATLVITPALAATFPEKAVTLVVPYPAGGGADTLARIVAKGMAPRLGKPVIVENKAGAGTVLGAGAVAQGPADGYTLLLSSNTTFTLNPALKRSLPYDSLASFESLGIIGSGPLVLIVHPAVPATTVQELVALAKAQPGKLSYGSFGSGTTAHFAGEMFKAAAGVDIVHVPYKGSAPAMQDLIGGQIQMSFDTATAAMAQVKAGRVRALALASLRPSKVMPGVPPLAQAGLPGFEMEPWITVVARSGMPAEARAVLTRAFAETIADPVVAEELTRAGVDVDFQPPAAYAARVANELPTLRAYVQKSGMAVE